jgi:WD40 repeat protein/tRNA A-37 threonylcarbamoyl transferase component Bud32
MTECKDAHPSTKQLAAFDSGLLRPEEWAVVERHVARCGACCDRLEALPEDGMVSLLRSCAAPPHRPQLADTRTLLPYSADTPVSRVLPAACEVPEELNDHPRYRVLEPIGAGGMGTVFKAEHRLMERMVALKVIRRDMTDKPEAVERFRMEVRAAASLSHTNIVTAYDAEQAGDVHFLVMEYVEGESLDKLIQRRGQLPVAEACEYVYQAAMGLQHAFECGMVHRDIKPANILLYHSPKRKRGDGRGPVADAPGSDAVVKILDFGLARFASERSPSGSLTPLGAVVGTPDYIAPEQALEPQKADIRADIYSLGCTLYHLLAGQPPFPEGTALQKLMSHQERKPKPIRECRDDLPDELVSVLRRMMAKEPAKRFQTPAAVIKALAPFVSQQSAERTGVTATYHPPIGRRWPWIAAAAGVVAAACVAGVVIWSLTRDRGRTGDQSASLFPGELRRLGGNAGPFTSVAFDRMVTRALTAGADKTLRLWDLDSGEEIAQLNGHTGTVVSIDFSFNGRSAISADLDKKIRVWDLAAGRQTGELNWTGGPIRSVAFTWDDRHALIAADDGTLAVWNTAEPDKPMQRQSIPAQISEVALDRFGTFVAAACPDSVLRVWDITKQWPGAELTGHDGAVTCLSWSRDARYVATGGADRTIRFWRAATGKQLRAYAGHTAPVRCVTISRYDGLIVSGGDDCSVRVWDVDSGRELRAFAGHEDAVLGVAVSLDGRRAFSAAKDGTLRVWKLPEVSGDTPAPFGDLAACVALSGQSDDGKEILATCGGDEAVRLWVLPSEKKAPPVHVLNGHTHMVVCVAVTRDGKTVASGSWDRTVKLWNVGDGKELRTLKRHGGVVRALAFTPDGKTLASASADQTIKLWDVGRTDLNPSHRDRTTPRCTLQGHTGAVLSLAFADDGKTLVSAGADETVRVWDIEQQKQLRVLTGHKGPVWSVAITRHGKYIASGGEDKTVRLWYTDTGKERTILSGHQDAVRAVAFTHDARGLASAGLDRTAREWDVARAQATSGKLEKNDDPPFTSLVYQDDGKLLVAGTADGNLKMWALTPMEKPPE